nr:acyltransferase [uncultured Pedobacter sp.]
MDNLLAKENNNFNLVRLFACLQVLVLHTYSFYNVGENTLFLKILWLFPGVIIFFTISGFLIAKSLENSTESSFGLKRVFRIYPALFVNVAITCLLLFYFNSASLNLDLFKYLLAQLSIFQFYTPESMKSFGMGHHPNGALWTISVELQFYIFFFLLTKITKWKNKSIRFKNNIIPYLVVLSCFVNYYVNKNLTFGSLGYKLLFNSLPYNFTFFGIGILLWINLASIKKLFYGKTAYWAGLLAIFICIIIVYDIKIARYQFDTISFLYLLLLILCMFSFAFSYTHLSFSLLKNVDVSYGTYIYHVLVINTFLQLRISSNYFILIYTLAILCGIASWYGIEKHFLAFSKKLRLDS